MSSLLSGRFVYKLISATTIAAGLVGLFSSPASALPAYACVDLFRAPFWTESKALVPRGPLAHLTTFSYDADVSFGAAFEAAMAGLRSTGVESGSVPDSGSGLSVASVELRKAFDAVTGPVSVKRLRFAIGSNDVSSALRPGVVGDAGDYRVTDLRPEAMSLVFSRADGVGFTDAGAALKTWLVPALRRAGLGADVIVRDRRLTVHHATATLSPVKFVSEIALLRSLVKPEHVDYHLGVPIDAVSEAQASSIGRVLEARSVLGALAGNGPTHGASGRGAGAASSDLRSDVDARSSSSVRKGSRAVTVEFEQFLSPYNAHDIEVKSVPHDSRDGFDALELGSRLAARNIDLPKPSFMQKSDLFYDVIASSLDLFGLVLRDQQLIEMSRELHASHGGKMLLERVRTYLRAHDIVARGTAALLK